MTDPTNALAIKIAEKANATLQPLQNEMDRMKWPQEFRKIMWQAVADTAAALAAEDKNGGFIVTRLPDDAGQQQKGQT
jgi:hypothetical protein